VELEELGCRRILRRAFFLGRPLAPSRAYAQRTFHEACLLGRQSEEHIYRQDGRSTCDIFGLHSRFPLRTIRQAALAMLDVTCIGFGSPKYQRNSLELGDQLKRMKEFLR